LQLEKLLRTLFCAAGSVIEWKAASERTRLQFKPTKKKKLKLHLTESRKEEKEEEEEAELADFGTSLSRFICGGRRRETKNRPRGKRTSN
jgi:hypothetical protein